MKTSLRRSLAAVLCLASLFLFACKSAGAGGGVEGTTIRVGTGAVGTKVGSFTVSSNKDMVVELTGSQKASGSWIWFWDPAESTEGYIVFIPSNESALPRLDISSGSEYRLEIADKAMKSKFGAKGSSGTASITVSKVQLPYKTRGQLAVATVSAVETVAKD